MNNRDEIKEIAPVLASLPVIETEIPSDDYYLKMQDDVWKKLELEEGEVSPEYFATMAEEVLRKVSKKSSFRIGPWANVTGIAASIALLLSIGFVLWDSAPIKAQNFEISEELAFYYFEKNADNVSLYDLAEYDLVTEETAIAEEFYGEEVIDAYLENMDATDLTIDYIELIDENILNDEN